MQIVDRAGTAAIEIVGAHAGAYAYAADLDVVALPAQAADDAVVGGMGAGGILFGQHPQQDGPCQGGGKQTGAGVFGPVAGLFGLVHHLIPAPVGSLVAAKALEQLARQYEVYHCWNEKGIFVMILGGRALDRAELEQNLRVLAQQEGASRQVVAAVGAPVTDPQALHLSYSLVCDMAELADLTQTDVILGIHADSRSMDAEQLVEEVRSFCYGTADAKDSHTIAAQLYWSVPYKEARDCLHHMVYAYLRVLTSEFPGAENLQEQLQERFTQRSWEVAGEEAVHLLAGALEWMKEDFEKRLDVLSPIVRLAIRYIHDSVRNRDGGSIKEFSSKSGVNPAYLGHLFKDETGNFFNSYLMQCRINRSVVLLKNPGCKIKDVASQVGFASTSYFVRCFRESKGVSPAKYRIGKEE